MRVLVQWARSTGQDWEEVQSGSWSATPARGDPTGLGLGLDSAPGWIAALNVQGVTFDGFDHYAVEDQSDGCVRVTCWRDDPADHPQRSAQVWTFAPLAPDPTLGGLYNTRQTVTIYTEEPFRWVANGWSDVRPWSELVLPPAPVVRHGKGAPDNVHQQHKAVRGLRGWREWTEGVPAHLVAGGRLKVGARG